MKKNIILILVAILGFVSFKTKAQDEDDKNDKVESLKIAFITDKLNLTSAEAKTFWPVFNEFTDEMKKVKKKEKENMLSFKAKANPTDQESDKFITDHLSSKQAELDITRKYINEFKKVLPGKKVARLLTLEQEFKQQLLQKLKERRERMPMR